MNLLCPHAPRSVARNVLKGSLRCSASRIGSSATVSPRSQCVAAQVRSIFFVDGPGRSQLRPRGSYLVLGQVSYGGRRTFFTEKIVRRYEELPRNYRDKSGLPFRGHDLTEAEVEKIFGPDIGASTANHLLRILHGRRVAGTLDDPAFSIHTAQFSEADIENGLAYLRKSVPVDEVVNAGLRAEDELNELALEEEQKEKKEKKKADKAAETMDEGKTEEEEVVYKPDPLYGRSVLEEIRARNIAKEKARQKALEEEQRQKELAGEIPGEEPQQRSLVEVAEGERPITNPGIAEYYKAAQSEMKEPPKMSLWERVAPSLVTVTLVVGFCASLCMVYEEPEDRYRLLREIPIASATLGTMVGLNLLVYLAWRVPPAWKFLNKYMVLVIGLPKPITLFTASYSHQRISHLLMNIVPLWLVGTYMHEELGRATFLTLYLACGSFGFLGSLIAYGARGMLGTTTLGASGATFGLIVAWFWEHRMERFKIMGMPESGVHGIVYWALIVALHLTRPSRIFPGRDGIDLVSHLVGMAVGMIGIELINRAGMGRRNAVSGGQEEEQPKDNESRDLVKDIVPVGTA